MLLLAIVSICILLLVLGFLVPRLSRRPERGVSRSLAAGERAGSSAPGALGRLLRKPFSAARRATHRSAALGRRGRSKTPL